MKKNIEWGDLGLHSWIEKQLKDLKLLYPNEIQCACIPEILAGKDCIACAKTGSGKTAVFALPIIQKLSEDPFGVCALVLTPTRELAAQIADQFKAFGKLINIKVSLIVGGNSSSQQSNELSQKPHIVVATPGRLASIFTDSDLKFNRLKFLILDEVDALLSPGEFENDISTILSKLPSAHARQTLAFSATSNKIIKNLTENLKCRKIKNQNVENYNIEKRNVENFNVENRDNKIETLFTFCSKELCSTAKNLDEFYCLVPNIAKDAYLVYVLKIKLGLGFIEEHGKIKTFKEEVKEINLGEGAKVRQAIVFVSTLWQCHVVGKLLGSFGFSVSILHSALTQPMRMKSLVKFRSCHTKVLVATSLAGRGLDIPSVDLVINYSLPYTCDEYVHHVGRTARAGRHGTSITLIAPYELDRLVEIEESIGKKLVEFEIENTKEPDKYVKCCALMRKEISTQLYHDDESQLNKKIERKKAKKSKITH